MDVKQEIFTISGQEIEEYAACMMKKNGILWEKNDQLQNQMGWLMEQISV